MNPLQMRSRVLPALAMMLLVPAVCVRPAFSQHGSIAKLHTVTVLSSTVPTNGD